MGQPVRSTPNHTRTALPFHALLADNSLILNEFIVSRCKFSCTGNPLNSLCHSHLAARNKRPEHSVIWM